MIEVGIANDGAVANDEAIANDQDATQHAIRVVVADDDHFTASLVKGGLEAQGFSVTTASSVAEAAAAIDEVDAHALVTDLNFGGGGSGAALLHRVAASYPWIGLVVLSSHRSPELAVPDSELIPPGVVYLVKSQLAGVEDLASAVHRAIGGHFEPTEPRNDDGTTVTRAQADVLRMLAEGASTRALADHRGTTVRAAETMLTRLYGALGLEQDDRSNPRVEAVNLWQQGKIRVR
ncbi:MAG: response regulator [Salinibacterium sp.]|nr:response regulator [Salinibacterium sp.]